MPIALNQVLCKQISHYIYLLSFIFIYKIAIMMLIRLGLEMWWFLVQECWPQIPSVPPSVRADCCPVDPTAPAGNAGRAGACAPEKSTKNRHEIPRENVTI